MVICLERGADLTMAQLIPLPLAVSCSSKIQIGFTFLVPAHLGSPGQRAVKRVCVFTVTQNTVFTILYNYLSTAVNVAASYIRVGLLQNLGACSLLCV